MAERASYPKWLERIGELDREGPAVCAEELSAIRARLRQVEHELLMPKYLFHSPMDYSVESSPPGFEASISVEGEELPVPPPHCRPGYSPNDDKYYLDWGRQDHDLIMDVVRRNGGRDQDASLLDWGCSSGRVLRHFFREHRERGWRLHGVDIQAYLVEWMRRSFPALFDVFTVSTLPHLPFADESIDVIYGISVLTHTKYLWDNWLAEFRRVLRPGGICIQSVQCEPAWRFYHQNRHEEWIRAGHPDSMLSIPEMDRDFFLYGDGFVSQTFFREEVVRRYFGRILPVVELMPPPANSYQNWVVMKKPA